MDKDSRNGGRSKAADTTDLTKILRTSSFEPLDHFIGKTADRAKLKTFGDSQGVVVVHSLRGRVLLLNVSAVHRIRECGLELIQSDLSAKVRWKQSVDQVRS